MQSRKRKAPGDVPVKARSKSARNIDIDRPCPGPHLRGDSYYRSLYSGAIDFQRLSKHDADFAAVLMKNGQVDFTDPATVMQLTKTLLKLDFGLEIELLDDRLCPPVPNRHNYILWLKDLMDTTSYSEPGGKVTGIDIGTGASCIYPLLGAAQREWYFIGTDIDAESLGCARRNVALNGLEDRIRIVAKTESDPYLLPLDDHQVEAVDFVMTNPPFYDSKADMITSAQKKARPPNSACTGAPVEMVVEGGEMAFVGRLLRESLQFRDRVRWYTSMFGKLSSLQEFVERLRHTGIDNYAVTEFVQGNKTKRWAVGWSFGSMRPSDKAARGLKAALWKSLLPPAVEIEVWKAPLSGAIAPLADHIDGVIGSLELISWEWGKEKLRGVGRARENVWSRAWRRKKQREKDALEDGIASASSQVEEGADNCRFGFRASMFISRSEATVSLRWLEGHEAGLFESFSGFLKSQLRNPQVNQ